ncbi:DAPK [Mytilus edulis]|uniref:DAPK n=1 Tax=Mytilus edulis TaxID=6550 RepID=A0A8S3UD99_MYTED|nr:DAPK [Mytilus edulis]
MNRSIPIFCRKNPDFEAPGQKLVVAGSVHGTLQGADCDDEFYQPFQFMSSGNSRCIYKKSICNEEGQVYSINGTLKKNRICRCDYTRGYDFVVRPNHRCYCEPSEEDCSCYLKLCSSYEMLSPAVTVLLWHHTYGNCPIRLKQYSTDFQEKTLIEWTNKLHKFVITRATQVIYNGILGENILVIAGPTGVGKSANAYHVAFGLNRKGGYTIVPASQPSDIIKYHLPGSKQVFIIDNFIGEYGVDETNVLLWEKHGPILKKIFQKSNETKLILTSRTYIWQPEQQKCMSILSPYTCDFLAKELTLVLEERRAICKSYLKPTEAARLHDDMIMMYNFFPYLCSFYSTSKDYNVNHLFPAPSQIIEDEINNFKRKSEVSYFALAILAIKQKIPQTFLTIDNHDSNELLQDMFHESAFLQYPSKKRLMSSLHGLSGSYVKQDIDGVVFVHETMQNIVLFCIAKTFMKTVIKYCKTDILLNHICLDCMDTEQDVLAIKVLTEHQETYFRRLVLELNKGFISAVFTNQQTKCETSRCMFLKYLQEHSKDLHMNKTQKGIAMHVVSTNGYREFVSFFLQDKIMANIKDSAGNTPLHTACKNGHIEVVVELIKNNSEIDIANTEGIKPLFMHVKIII